MTRSFTLLITVLIGLGWCWAADQTVVGKWDCTSTDDAGQESVWTLVVRDDGGKLAGSLIGDPGEFELADVKLDGDAFTFKVLVGPDTYSVETRIHGKRLEGKFRGPESTGTLKATKQA
jgi:hypothetical protein